METKEEFIEYIKQYNKNPGEYSLDELMQIGATMRTLPKPIRDWPWLHAYLGIKWFSSEAYRMRVHKYIKEGKFFNEEQGSIDFREEYISKSQAREWYNAYRRSIRDEIRIDNLKDEIKLAVSKVNALPKIKTNPIKKSNCKKEAILLFSDLHIGVDCDNYYNKYNFEVAKERLSKLVEEVIYYCKSNEVSKLNFLNLGDAISGLIHTNSRIEQQMDVAEQIMVAAEYISQVLNELTSMGIEITYRSVYDNHSRAVADKNQHIEKEQFSRIIDWYIEERLKDTSIKFMKDNIDGGIGKFKIFDRTIMFAHGHQDSRTGTVQNFVGLTKEWIDYICLAHFHNPAEKDYQGCKVFINGSIVGTEQYAFGRRLFTKPSQKLLVFQENSSNIIDIDIGL